MKNRLRHATTTFSVFAVATLVAAGIASAVTSSFGPYRVPRYGSDTFTQDDWTTTPDRSSIAIKFDELPYDVNVKPVRCNTYSDIAGYTRIDADDEGVWKTLAASVPDGVCFHLNMDAPTTRYFTVSGQVRH